MLFSNYPSGNLAPLSTFIFELYRIHYINLKTIIDSPSFSPFRRRYMKTLFEPEEFCLHPVGEYLLF